MKPYGTTSYYEWVKIAQRLDAGDVIKHIECPVFIADPRTSGSGGQFHEIYDALECPKTFIRSTAEEGANWHCEPKNRSLYD